MSTRINVQKFGGHVEVASNLTVDTSTLHVDSMSNRIGVGTVNPYSKMTVLGDILINTGEASWDTGMKNLLGTQDLISAGIASGAGTGSISASTDVDLPLEVVNDVIAKFVNINAVEVITEPVSTGYTPALNDSVQFDLWIYNSSGATISVEFFAFSGGTQSDSFDALSNSTWTRYSRSITIGSGNVGSVLQIRMDNNTSGKTFYFTGLSTRINPSNTTNPVFTPKGFPISGTGTTFSVPNTVAHEASIGSVTITDTTASVSTTTGALKVVGGVGIVGDIYANAFKGNADTASQVYVASRDSENATHYPTFTTTEVDGNTSIYQDSGLTYNPSTGILATARYYTDDYLTHNGDDNTYIGFPADDTFTVTTAGSERMRVNSSGNVGIGTTDPGTYKLKVNGTLNSQALSATTGTFTGAVTVPDDGDFVMNSKPLVPATGMYWDRVNSRLGVGTTSPIAQLHIGPKDNDHIYLASDNNNYGWKIDTDDQGNGEVPFRIIKRSGGIDATVLTIKNQNGNVGIGTSSPGYKLDVNGTLNSGALTATSGTFSGALAATTGSFSGNVSLNNNKLLVSGDVTTDSTAGISWHGTNSGYSITRTSGAWGAPNYQQLKIYWATGMILDAGNGDYGRSYVGVNDRMAIGSSYYNSDTKPPDNGLLVEGNVGIGTTGPGTKLDVNGTLRHTGLTMSAGTGIDQIKEITVTLQLSTSWQDTGINHNDLPTGSYIVQIANVNNHTVGGGNYEEYYTGVMSWFGGTTNSAQASEIPMTVAGHAPNDGHIYLQVIRTTATDGRHLRLQMRGQLNTTGNYDYLFKFRKLI